MQEYPFVSPFDLRGEKKFIWRTETKYLSKEGLSVPPEFSPQYAVLVVCIGSTIGKTGIVSGKVLATKISR